MTLHAELVAVRTVCRDCDWQWVPEAERTKDGRDPGQLARTAAYCHAKTKGHKTAFARETEYNGRGES